jgi:hypothetical protein
MHLMPAGVPLQCGEELFSMDMEAVSPLAPTDVTAWSGGTNPAVSHVALWAQRSCDPPSVRLWGIFIELMVYAVVS